jgi:hypothetical protein
MNNDPNTPQNPPLNDASSSAPVVSAPPEPTPTSPPTPVSTPPETPKTPGGNKGILKIALLALAIVGLVAVSSGATYAYMTSTKRKSETSFNNQIAALQNPEYTLPEGAVKVSDCVPSMGVHYILKDSDPEYGPFVVTNNKGKVIGIEYMAAGDMYTNIPNTDPPVALVEKNSPVFGWKINHAEVSHLPKGHPGLTRDHVDVHLFTVSMEEEMNACK